MNDFSARPQKLEIPERGVRTILGQLPMYHAFGMCVFLTTALWVSSKFVIIPRFTEESFLSTIEVNSTANSINDFTTILQLFSKFIFQKYKITTVYAVPPTMVFLAKSPLVLTYDLSSVKVIWSGAAPLSKKVENIVKDRTGVKLIRQGYGMTEGTYTFCAQNDQYHTNGSVGVLLRGLYGRVVDVDSGKILEPNQTGELHFKGQTIMKGYIGNAQATSATIDADGWLHTGDVGYYDTNGEWFIVDRIKELIKYKAFQVPPAEIEAVLLTHPQIKDAGVVGVLKEESGEAAFAFVVKQPNAQITECDVFQYVAGDHPISSLFKSFLSIALLRTYNLLQLSERLSNPKRLHGGIKFVDAIPKSLTGKILRRVLRNMATDLKSKL